MIFSNTLESSIARFLSESEATSIFFSVKYKLVLSPINLQSVRWTQLRANLCNFWSKALEWGQLNYTDPQSLWKKYYIFFSWQPHFKRYSGNRYESPAPDCWIIQKHFVTLAYWVYDMYICFYFQILTATSLLSVENTIWIRFIWVVAC